MKSTVTLPFLALAILAVSACKREDSANIDQQRIYADYEYTYDGDSYQSIAEVTFRLDNSKGTKIELSDPANVRFNGEAMSYKNSSGSYRLNSSVNVIGGTYKYTDMGTQTYENSTAALTYIDLPYGLSAISRNGSFFLPWSGDPLQAGEAITVTISGGDQSGSETWTINTVGASYIVLDQYKLNDLRAGTAYIQIKRQVVSGIHQSTLAGGKITSTYLSHKLQIWVTE